MYPSHVSVWKFSRFNFFRLRRHICERELVLQVAEMTGIHFEGRSLLLIYQSAGQACLFSRKVLVFSGEDSVCDEGKNLSSSSSDCFGQPNQSSWNTFEVSHSVTHFSMTLNSSCNFLLTSHKFSVMSWNTDIGSRLFFLELVLHTFNKKIFNSVTENYISFTVKSSLALSCELWFSNVWKGREPLSAPDCCSPLYFDG